MLAWIKKLLISSQLPDWRNVGSLDDGYTIILPSPMDMPFLLRLGLEGLRNIATDNCRQILIVPDGWGDDGGAALKAVANEFDDPRIQYVELRQRDYWLIRAMRPPGCAATHWMQVVNGTKHTRCKYAFLHDADAFFVDEDGLERQYDEACDRGMHTLGVTPRWDPFFAQLGYMIPGTWELMYSVRWARSRRPYELKGRRINTPHGPHIFDSMLYPQYLDYESGKVGVSESPPDIVHFNGTVFTYRLFRDSGDRQVVDEFFRLLLLALLADAVEGPRAERSVPQTEQLAAGLTDRRAKMRYDSPTCVEQYPIFRRLLEQLCATPMIPSDRRCTIEQGVAPFDEYFRCQVPESASPTTAPAIERSPFMRVSALG